MKIGQYWQRQRCKHVELEQFWQAFASRGFVSDSWVFLLLLTCDMSVVTVLSECAIPECDSRHFNLMLRTVTEQSRLCHQQNIMDKNIL